jgi:hypothetical protein
MKLMDVGKPELPRNGLRVLKADFWKADFWERLGHRTSVHCQAWPMFDANRQLRKVFLKLCR